MSFELSKISQGSFCAQAVSTAGTGQWYALIVHDVRTVSAVTEDVTEEINLTLDEGQTAAAVDLHTGVAKAVQQVASSTQPLLVLSGFEGLQDADWEALNFSRSRLLGNHTLVLVLGKAALRKLQDSAPDLDSLLSGSTWQLDPQADTLSPDDQEARLQALRDGLNLTDADVLKQAEAGELSPDPRLAEWLVLLGRGDLLVR